MAEQPKQRPNPLTMRAKGDQPTNMTLEIPIKKARELFPNIPDRIVMSIYRYVEGRVPVGGFLRAALQNDFVETINHYGERNNMQGLLELSKLIWNYVPGNCWGSREKYMNWLYGYRKGGELDGKN